MDARPQNPGADDPVRIGGYRLEKLLGRGGQGSVWRARDEQLGRVVALKVLTELSVDGLARFEREARIASRLEHPGICTIYGTGREGDTAWIAMQYVAGESLATQIRALREVRDGEASAEISGDAAAAPRIPLPAPLDSSSHAGSSQQDHVDRLLRWFATAARCLHAAHHAGLVHRDVKPGNLMVTEDGEPVLLDFGLARDADSPAAGLTAASALVGTPEYMAPEQLRFGHASREPGPRTDLWGLGVSLYEALTLEQPFRAATWSELVHLIAEHPLADPCRRRRGVPRELRAVLETALEKNPERRYRSAAEFADDLDRVRHGEPIQARPIPFGRRLWLWSKRRPALAVSSLALVLLTALLLWTGSRAAEQRLREAREIEARARLLYESADWERSLELIRSARQLGHPEPAELDLLAVAAHAGLGQVEQARTLLQAMPWQDDPRRHALVQLWRGELTLVIPGSPDAGLDEIFDALDSGGLPEDEAAYARALVEADPSIALAATEQALERNPRHRRAREARCLLLQAVDSDKARTLAQALLDQRPDDPLALTMFGIAVQRTSGGASARSALEAARERARRDPRWSPADEVQARRLEEDLQAFLRDLDLFRAMEPGMVAALIAARSAATAATAPNAATTAASPVAEIERLLPLILERVIQDSSNLRQQLPRRTPLALTNAWSEFQRALLEVLGKPPDLAEFHLDQLLALRPDGAVLLLRGYLRLRDGRLMAAADDFEAAWSAQSRFDVSGLATILALHARERAWALAAASRGARAEARGGVQRALDRLLTEMRRRTEMRRLDARHDDPDAAALIGPHHRRLLDESVAIALVLGDLPRADLLARSWREHAPEDGRAWWRHAEVCRAQGHLFRARDFVEVARQLDPADADARRLLGEIEAQLPQSR